ncbi:hypothetical protein KZZ52_19440 [Dactylosporangium sp. AC04546]|uniref:hypothetical protein n=1 Tax=Dactylosporangium sp. AC04546 TaxID=2862460 RepID=UPI001EDCC413|nr:hypothetical protein [Dactylosporangium sp. AC04546]WVK87477.1 hypothetical protein KZZ52_19440 [Dactylosporangium sp. AC04546]
MTESDGRLMWTAVIAGLLFGWLGFRIFDARDQLDHYGVDPTVAGALAGWLAVLTGVGYLGLALLVWRKFARSRLVALGLLVPAVVCAGYALLLAVENTGKVGFSAGSLIVSGLVNVLAAVVTAVRAARE